MKSFSKRGASALLVMVAAACTSGEATDAPRLQTVGVSRGNLIIRAEATGTVEPIRSVEVKSKASGEILSLHVDIGDNVEPGTLLAEVDPRDVRNAYEQAKADLDVAVARSQISKAQLERSQSLLDAGVITEQEHESRRLDNANSLANQVKAETNFELAEARLEDVTIRAPMRGTIISKSVEEGGVIQSASGNVSGGTTLFVMADLDQMQVRTLVDETDMGEIRAGLLANVSVESYPGRTFTGNVQKIEPQATVQQNVTMFPVIVTLDNSSGMLKPGMNAEVEILIDEAVDVLLAPNSAIVQVADVGPAAMAVGLDVESLDLSQFGRGGRGAGRAGQGQGAGGGPEAGTAGGAPAGAGAGASPGAAATPQGDAQQQMAQMRARIESGEIPQDSARALVQGLRGVGGGGAGVGGGRRAGSGGGQAATVDAGRAAGAPPRETTSAVVFVMGADSVPEPRMVQIGLNDWDNTEIVGGLDGTETLVIVGAAQLQANQQRFLDNVAQRAGNPFGGGGGGMGGGGRGR